MVKKALLIGINYKGIQGAELRGCINDIQHIKYFLLNHAGYKASDLTILTDDSNIKPTKQNMETYIRQLTRDTRPGDRLFFYYSGHGTTVLDRNGDEHDGRDEVIVPLDYNRSGVITDDWLNENLINQVKTGVTLYGFLDCCNSGTLYDLKFNWMSNCKPKNGRIPTKYNPDEWTNEFSFWREKHDEVPGTVLMFSGCMSSQTSADAFLDSKYQGAFSFCFISFLKENLVTTADGKKIFKNGVIKLRNLLKEINAKLDINKFEQNSQLSCGRLEEFDLPFTL